jgi:hypothetical protein
LLARPGGRQSARSIRSKKWLVTAESGRVRHLVEAVGQRLRPDPDRLEQDRVPWVHSVILPVAPQVIVPLLASRSAPG